MGYTHYWRRVKDLSEGWREFIEDVRKVYRNLPEYSESAGGYYRDRAIRICGGLGEGEPVFNEDEVWFNGDAERGLDHETFWLVRDIDIEIKSYLEYYKERYGVRSIEEAREMGLYFPKPDEDGYYFNFCKTARKPYDFFVCAVLILAKIHFGDRIKVSTDGTLEDWLPVIDFMHSLGYSVPRNMFS